MKYAWLAEFMGSSTTEKDASSFGEYLCQHGYFVPVDLPSDGTKSIRDPDDLDKPISDADWEHLLNTWSAETDIETY